MKKMLLLIALLSLTSGLFLCGCNWLQPGRTTAPAKWTPTPPAGKTQSVSTVAPDKTASQDTAGAQTKLPEAATAAP